ncbi:MAG: efflux RND transporter periplasmic adaptor subunit [Anaerolineae bacterium]|nr:efflux RND transporter periplasmic adaptor subunit [Anaerolineae bacterium]
MFKNRTFWIVVVVLIVAAAAYYLTIGRSTAADGTTYETETAARGTLTANVGATGTVRAGQSAILTWQTGGRVEAVNALIGQQVAQDEILASLLQTSLSQGIILAEADLVSAQKNLDNVLQSSLALAQAEQNLANARQAVKDAEENLTKLDYRRATDNLIQQTQANIDLAKKNVALAESAYKAVQNRPDGDSKKAQALLELTNARQELTTQTNNLNWYTGTPTNLDAEKYRAALAVAAAQLSDAEREVTRLKDGPTADDVAAAEARVAAAQATLNQARIIAPFDGTVTSSDLQPGDVVTAGRTAFRVDDLSHLLVDLQISEVDINDIQVGQVVTLSFDAIQSKTYNGQVIKVNQAGDSTTGAVNFTVTVELTDADELVKPGMTAAVNITVKEITDALIVPNRAVRVVDSQRIVYVLQDGVLTMVNIRLGASSDTVSEVVGGDLVEGDLVVLNPPAAMFGPGSGGPPAGMRGN